MPGLMVVYVFGSLAFLAALWLFTSLLFDWTQALDAFATRLFKWSLLIAIGSFLTWLVNNFQVMRV